MDMSGIYITQTQSPFACQDIIHLIIGVMLVLQIH